MKGAIPLKSTMATTVHFVADQEMDRELLVDPMCGFSALHDDVMGRIRVQATTDGVARG